MQENNSLLSSTNYFTRAMELTHMYIPGVTQQERLAAEQYLMTLRDTADGLNLSFHIITNEPVHDLRCFWAFNTIMHHLPNLASTVNDTQAEELYRVLFSFIYRYFFSSPVQRQTTDFLANKHAQMMVVGLQEFFPLRWRSFFEDVFELFALRETLPHVSDAVTVYLLRLFEYVDERVVSVRAQVNRCRELRARDMELKDAMREHVIPRAVATWYIILCECRLRAADIANICLCVLQTYIEWVDVALLMTVEWINLFYFFITVPSLRKAACECIFSLVEKKQLLAVKYELLRVLNIVDALPRILGLLQVPPITDEDLNFLEIVAKLTRAVAEQFFAIYEQLSITAQGTTGNNNNSDSSYNNNNNNNNNNKNKNDSINYVSGNKSNHYHFDGSFNNKSTTGGNGNIGNFVSIYGTNNNNNNNNNHHHHSIVSSHNFNKNSTNSGMERSLLQLEDGYLSCDLLTDVSAALDTVVTYLLRLLGINQSVVSSSIFPFIQIYAKSTALREEQAAQLLFTLYEHTRIYNLVEDEGKIWLEEVVNQRKQCHNLIRLLFVRYPLIVYQHLQAVISRITISTDKEQKETAATAALLCHNGTINENENHEYQQGQHQREENMSCISNCGNSGQNPDDIEAALRYLYELGESFRMDKLKSMDNEFSQLVAAVLSSERIACCSCAVVHLSCFEVFDRYHNFFIYHKEYIPLLLKCFLLSSNGVTNRNSRVRARICYLFGHMMQLLKRHLLPHKESIVNALYGIFLSNVLLPSDLCELYEAAGSLYSVAPISSIKETDDQMVITQVIQSVLQNLRHVSSLPSSALTYSSQNAVEYSARSETVADTISFLTALAKGLRGNSGSGSSNSNGGSNSCGDGGNNVLFADAVAAEMFHNITCDVSDVLRVWHLSACVRERVAQYFTQMIHTLPFDSMEVYFAAYLADWLEWMETVPELTKLLRLLHQFINCGGARVAGVLAGILPLVMRKVAAVGELSAMPDEGGVVSEITREKCEVHRQLFSVLHGATQAGCVAVVISLPPSELSSLLSRLLQAIHLPSETEMPKLALQIMTKITTTDWESGVSVECSGNSAEKDISISNCNRGSCSKNITNIVTSDTINNRNNNGFCDSGCGANKLVSDSCCVNNIGGASSNTNVNINTTITNNNDGCSRCCCGKGTITTAMWLTFMLNSVVPTVFSRFTLSTFELKDAKNFFLIGETGLLLKALIDRLGPNDSSLCELLYATMRPIVGEEEVTGFITALQNEQRFSAEMKRRFCYILQMAKERCL